MSDPFVKITIQVEEADGTVTVIEAPKAEFLKIDTRGVKHERLVDFGPTSYYQTLQDMEISFTGNYDDSAGCIFRQTKTFPPAKEVKKDE